MEVHIVIFDRQLGSLSLFFQKLTSNISKLGSVFSPRTLARNKQTYTYIFINYCIMLLWIHGMIEHNEMSDTSDTQTLPLFFYRYVEKSRAPYRYLEKSWASISLFWKKNSKKTQYRYKYSYKKISVVQCNCVVTTQIPWLRFL